MRNLSKPKSPSFIRKGNITLEGIKDSSKGSGATPVGVARATPRKLD